MTGKEALDILTQVTNIQNLLIDEYDRSAFFQLGVLTERLAQMVRIDQDSFNPTVKDEEMV
jgi:hypothetical protein